MFNSDSQRVNTCGNCKYLNTETVYWTGMGGYFPYKHYVQPRDILYEELCESSCHRKSITDKGFPAVAQNDWCGEHELKEKKENEK